MSSKTPTAEPRPGLYVISAPSGAGKTSLVKALLERFPQVCMSVSYTTRARRPSEIDGTDYFFVDEEQFQDMVAAGGFLEHANVFDNSYGTSREQVDALIERGHPVVLEIDWQGARQVRTAASACETVFILPPSRPELERRLRGRGTDSEQVIRRRLSDAASDMTHWREFDYVVINDDFETAVDQLTAILAGSGDALRSTRAALAPLLGELAGQAQA